MKIDYITLYLIRFWYKEYTIHTKMEKLSEGYPKEHNIISKINGFLKLMITYTVSSESKFKKQSRKENDCLAS